MKYELKSRTQNECMHPHINIATSQNWLFYWVGLLFHSILYYTTYLDLQKPRLGSAIVSGPSHIWNVFCSNFSTCELLPRFWNKWSHNPTRYEITKLLFHHTLVYILFKYYIILSASLIYVLTTNACTPLCIRLYISFTNEQIETLATMKLRQNS